MYLQVFVREEITDKQAIFNSLANSFDLKVSYPLKKISIGVHQTEENSTKIVVNRKEFNIALKWLRAKHKCDSVYVIVSCLFNILSIYLLVFNVILISVEIPVKLKQEVVTPLYSKCVSKW